jgi:hypothetical protein
MLQWKHKHEAQEIFDPDPYATNSTVMAQNIPVISTKSQVTP